MQNFISSYGYLAIVLLMMAESACIPIPSELTMLFGGALAAGAVAGVHLNLALVIVVGVAGDVLGRTRVRGPKRTAKDGLTWSA